MKIYARIENNKVQELFTTELGIYDIFPTSWVWIDVSNEKETPCVGWNFVDETFSPSSLYAPKAATNTELEEARLVAYAHPVTGSDRYFAESLALQAEGYTASSPEVKDARSKGVLRKSEIKAMYPYTE